MSLENAGAQGGEPMTVKDLKDRLRELHQRTAETPLFNPVFQLGLELSRWLESGKMTLDDIDILIVEMECEGLRARAGQIHDSLETVAVAENEASFTQVAEAIARPADFPAFARRWRRPAGNIVFTAHPTFLLSAAQAEAVASSVANGDMSEASVCVAPRERDTITLDYEHDAAMAAMARGQKARDRLNARLFDIAAARWPADWKELRPMPVHFAHWVGYDMDGRTDISWSTSIRYRLEEKAQRLSGYAASLADVAPDIAEALTRARDHSLAAAQAFRQELGDVAALSSAANGLITEHPDKIITLAPLIARLEERARHADDAQARALLVASAAMRADGLGMGGIHFRVNASQLQNAIRHRIDPSGKLRLASQAALAKMRGLLAEVKPLRSNFAALAIENSTAVRQFLAIAQILTHIDSDTPVRLLIAECEQPTTLLAALYFARMFGVEDKVDVSPLFETEAALEHGGRFLDAVLAEPSYQAYARLRGRVAIQTGFSDAGRFVGQIPAALAIERLQGRLADAMSANGLTDVSALIFNTGGESMGRGCHPSSIDDRFEWQMSGWARRRFLRADITLEPEISFQGGDGYLWFGSDELAFATLTRLAEAPLWAADVQAEPDIFYRRTDLSIDFYREIRAVQHDHLQSATYSRAITAFGLGLLNDTGSRKSRRQSDLASDRSINLRQIRAIPHNAILQQLGYPVNVIAGIGTAADGNREEIAALLRESARGRQIVRLARAANALASIKTVSAYGELFNSAYWASRTYRGSEEHISDACLHLSEFLTHDDRVGAFRRLASRLRIDALKLHRLFALIPEDARHDNREQIRRSIGVLHALRIALFKYMFLRAVMVPPFSRANDISREDVLEMFFSLRVDEGLVQLKRAFPVAFPSIDDFAIAAPSDYPDATATSYRKIHEQYIQPIDDAFALSLRITTALANRFGAHG